MFHSLCYEPLFDRGAMCKNINTYVGGGQDKAVIGAAYASITSIFFVQ